MQIAVCRMKTRGKKPPASDCTLLKCVELPFPSWGADHKLGNQRVIQANLSNVIFRSHWCIAIAILFQLKLFLFNNFCLTCVFEDILHYAGFLFTQNGGWIPLMKTTKEKDCSQTTCSIDELIFVNLQHFNTDQQVVDPWEVLFTEFFTGSYHWTSIPSRGEYKSSELLHATETGISSARWATWLVCRLNVYLIYTTCKDRAAQKYYCMLHEWRSRVQVTQYLMVAQFNQ